MGQPADPGRRPARPRHRARRRPPRSSAPTPRFSPVDELRRPDPVAARPRAGTPWSTCGRVPGPDAGRVPARLPERLHPTLAAGHAARRGGWRSTWSGTGNRWPHVWYRLEAGGGAASPGTAAATSSASRPCTSWPAHGVHEARRVSDSTLWIPPGSSRTSYATLPFTRGLRDSRSRGTPRPRGHGFGRPGTLERRPPDDLQRPTVDRRGRHGVDGRTDRRPGPAAAALIMLALLAWLWLLEVVDQSQRQPARQLRHPRPGARRPARDRVRAVPARRLGPPDQQLGAVLRARLPGAARWPGPLAAVLADQHRRLRAGRLAADPGRHDHPGRQRPDLRLAHLPAGPRASGPGGRGRWSSPSWCCWSTAG